MSEERLPQIDRRFDRVEEHLERLEAGQTELRSGLTDLDQRMHVLHEHAITEIKGISEHKLATEAEMNRGFDELKEMIGRRLGPLEAAVHHHSGEIERLKQGRS